MPELVAVPQITALYAGLLGLMAVVLSILVGRYRAPSADRRVSIGDGGRPEVLVAMRHDAAAGRLVDLGDCGLLTAWAVRFRSRFGSARAVAPAGEGDQGRAHQPEYRVHDESHLGCSFASDDDDRAHHL